MTSIGQLLDELARISPDVRVLRAEHLRDNGEVLPHVLFGDLTDWLAGHLPQPAVLALIDEAFVAGDAATKDLILASFLENIESGDEFASLREALSPRLRQVWEGYYGLGGDPVSPT